MAHFITHSAVSLKLCMILPWWASIPCSFMSHFVLDKFPESDQYYLVVTGKQKLNPEIVIGLVLMTIATLIIGFVLYKNWAWLHLLNCLLVGNLPDIIDYFRKVPLFFCHKSGYQKMCLPPLNSGIIESFLCIMSVI